MGAYVARRFLYMLILVLLSTVVAFAIIVLPPGDYLTSYVTQLEAQGGDVTDEEIAALRSAYGLGQPEYVQYIRWMNGLLTDFDLGRSLAQRAVPRQTIGPVLLQSLLTEDMFLASGILLVLTVLTIVGTFISDLALTWVDPRIRMERN